MYVRYGAWVDLGHYLFSSPRHLGARPVPAEEGPKSTGEGLAPTQRGDTVAEVVSCLQECFTYCFCWVSLASDGHSAIQSLVGLSSMGRE